MTGTFTVSYRYQSASPHCVASTWLDLPNSAHRLELTAADTDFALARDRLRDLLGSLPPVPPPDNIILAEMTTMKEPTHV